MVNDSIVRCCLFYGIVSVGQVSHLICRTFFKIIVFFCSAAREMEVYKGNILERKEVKFLILLFTDV